MTIDRTTLRWNGWGPVKQENPLPADAPQWAWIEEALGVSRLPSTPAVASLRSWIPTLAPVRATKSSAVRRDRG